MAVTFRAETTNSGATGITATVDKTPSLANGDIVTIYYIQSGGSLPTDPSGFTVIATSTTITNPKCAVWRKVITDAAGEPATWDTGSNANGAWGMRTVTAVGGDTSTPEDVTPTVTVNDVSGNPATGDITPVTNGCGIISLVAVNSSTRTFTDQGAGWTNGIELGNRKNQTAWEVQTTAALLTVTWTISGNATGRTVINVAIRPATAAPDAPFPPFNQLVKPQPVYRM